MSTSSINPTALPVYVRKAIEAAVDNGGLNGKDVNITEMMKQNPSLRQ